MIRNNRKRAESQVQVNDLRSISASSESIKQIIDDSRAIRMASLNATLLAARAGQTAAGFRVVSAELRTFSNRLEAHMSVLTETISSMVRIIAELSKQIRMIGYLKRSQESSGQPHLAQVLEGKHRELDAGQERFRDQQRQLLQHLVYARKLCQTGSAATRAAKIEAVYSAAFRQPLQIVADESEARIAGIVDMIKNIQKSSEDAA